MAETFDVDQLDQMKRPQLQKLCKQLGIKANSKVNLTLYAYSSNKTAVIAKYFSKLVVYYNICPCRSERTRLNGSFTMLFFYALFTDKPTH